MGDHGLSSPLLPPPSDHQPHLIVTVHDNDNEVRSLRNPFAFLGSSRFSVPVSTTADPFKNQTREISGVYEWLKIGVCLPIAAARLLLFGASLLIGFVATKIALLGWKDRQNPMPLWALPCHVDHEPLYQMYSLRLWVPLDKAEREACTQSYSPDCCIQSCVFYLQDVIKEGVELFAVDGCNGIGEEDCEFDGEDGQVLAGFT